MTRKRFCQDIYVTQFARIFVAKMTHLKYTVPPRKSDGYLQSPIEFIEYPMFRSSGSDSVSL